MELGSVPVSLGRHRLLFAIGHGGMSDVWLAVISSAAFVDKLLVIKQLRASLLDDPELLSMFMDEARLAARLHHPNLVQTFEVGQEGPIPYMSMEFLDGQPLHRIARRLAEEGVEPLPLGMRLRIITELLEGLRYAHELRDYDGSALRVVHRDISPQNLFITYEGQIKLVDFGIAKASDSVTHTDGRGLKGKLAYMSPEQARAEPVDGRTDVFAVGVMLWELLAGSRLWADVNEAVLVRRLTEGDLPPLARPTIPPRLEEICRRALAVDRADRFDSADALRAEIERFIVDERLDVSPRAIGKRVAEAFAPERSIMRDRIDSALMVLAGRDGPTPPAGPLLQDPPLGEAGLGPDEDTADYGPKITTAQADPTPATNHPRPRLWLAMVPATLVAVATVFGLEWARGSENESTATPIEVPEQHAVSVRPSVATRDCNAPDKPLIDLTGDLDEDATLTCDREYLLRYETRVTPGVTLTIEPGTVLRGDFETKGLLLVRPGGRLIAEGTNARPIVFTSDRPADQAAPGDWGGVILLGRAPINMGSARVEGIDRGGEYGGNDPDDDSGILRYVRIEYAGMELAPNNELNGLTLAGVGRGTQIDHVQVRATTDDCFEFFGGTVDATHLACVDPGDDGFDFDLGYRGHLQFLAFRDRNPDGPGNAFEFDSDPTGSGLEPRTHPVIWNATACGRSGDRSQSFGLLVRHAASAEVHNLLLAGFDHALEVRDPETAITGAGIGLFDQSMAEADEADDDRSFDEAGWFGDPAREVTITRQPFGLCDADAAVPWLPPQAAAPIDDGFFDATATWLGASPGGPGDWLLEPWLVWATAPGVEPK